MAPEICPVCGADVPEGARACPECGADEATGWSEKARYDELGIPDESFDYNEFVKREFEGGASSKGRRKHVVVIGTILLLIALLSGAIYLLSYLLANIFQR